MTAGSLPHGQICHKGKFTSGALAVGFPLGQTRRMSLRIRYWRKKRGLTQEGLAERAGFAVSQVSRWERWKMGKKRPPDAAQLTKIAEALGVRPGDLMPSGRAVPVVGYVGAGQQVFGIDDHARGLNTRATIPAFDIQSIPNILIFAEG